MKYIVLAAGMGTRLSPLTNESPKCLYTLHGTTTVLQRAVELISRFDPSASIVVVSGYFSRNIIEALQPYPNITHVLNPFYKVTNSIASLWFAREHLNEAVVILNADVVFDETMAAEVITHPGEGASVLVDSSIKSAGDYNVQVCNGSVTVMSKELSDYYGEYAGITKLDAASATVLCEEICTIVESGYYDQWYENALVQMIFKRDFHLQYIDVSRYAWTEVDTVDDLLQAKRIHLRDQNPHLQLNQ